VEWVALVQMRIRHGPLQHQQEHRVIMPAAVVADHGMPELVGPVELVAVELALAHQAELQQMAQLTQAAVQVGVKTPPQL
jgi:hypothetical protein